MRRTHIPSLLRILSFGFCLDCSAEPVAVQSVHELSKISAWHSLLALILVLSLFYVCVWGFRKLNMSAGNAEHARMRIIGGLNLGFREKIILLQVGSKQLVLAVTPGRIETLTVLEGEDCVQDSTGSLSLSNSNDFSQKLMQAMKGRTNG